MPTAFLIAWITAQVGCLGFLWLGSKLAGHRFLLRIGRIANDRKMSALDRYWPLTRIRPALARGDRTTCAAILSVLIGAKSTMSFLLGMVVLFWLPFACLLVPSIIAVHDPTDRELAAWVTRVAILQVTSHVSAAALGFTIVREAMVTGEPVVDVARVHLALLIPVLVLSCGFALAAGVTEASGLMRRGL